MGDDARAEALRPVTWDEWIVLPIRPQDNAVRTARGHRGRELRQGAEEHPKLCARTIRERDGNRCQYTGKLLKPREGSLDHVLARRQGLFGTRTASPSGSCF